MSKFGQDVISRKLLKNFYRILAAVLLSGLISTESGFAQGTQNIRERFVVEGSINKILPFRNNGYLSIDNVNGNIRIESWDRNDVSLEIRERRRTSQQVEVIVSISNSKMKINTRYQRSLGFRGRSTVVNYVIRVPKNTEIVAETTNGNVEINNIDEDIEAESTNGRVEVRDVVGDVNARTTNGKIDIQSIKGVLSARTTNSDIFINNVESEEISAITTNGSVRAFLKLQARGFYEVKTTNGSVNVTIPEQSEVDVEVSCKLRNFTSDFDFLNRIDRKERARSWESTRRFRGTINGGGASLILGTTNGRVSLKAG